MFDDAYVVVNKCQRWIVIFLPHSLKTGSEMSRKKLCNFDGCRRNLVGCVQLH